MQTALTMKKTLISIDYPLRNDIFQKLLFSESSFFPFRVSAEKRVMAEYGNFDSLYNNLYLFLTKNIIFRKKLTKYSVYFTAICTNYVFFQNKH